MIAPDLEDTNKMYLFMYYASACTSDKEGEYILVYMQIIVRDSTNSEWYTDVTYIGKALVGDYFDGGNSGKTTLTIGVSTWEYGAPTTE